MKRQSQSFTLRGCSLISTDKVAFIAEDSRSAFDQSTMHHLASYHSFVFETTLLVKRNDSEDWLSS